MINMTNAEIISLNLRRSDICDLMIATLGIKFDMEDEIRNPETTESRRNVLKNSIGKWERLHDELKKQLDEADNQ